MAVTKLSLWDQVAPRVYINIALCFPNSDASKNVSIEAHIRSALDRLAAERPDLAGQLVTPDGVNIYLQTSSSDRITLSSTSDHNTRYDRLRDGKFPAGFFVHPKYAFLYPIDVGKSGPVSAVQLVFLDGGFVVLVRLHHSYADGRCLNTFLELFAAATQPNTQPSGTSDAKTNCTLALGPSITNQGGFQELLAKCEEYTLLPAPTGPTQPPAPRTAPSPGNAPVGKIFVMDGAKLDALCKSDNTIRISKFAAMARLMTEKPEFHNPQDWTNPLKNLFAGNDSIKSYFGNAITMANTYSIKTTGGLLKACNWKSDSTPLLTVAGAITDANKAIDEKYVLLRSALFASAPDIRRLGLSLDSANQPSSFSANTWAFLGSKAKFWFPGMSPGSEGRLPDAIRRVQTQWATGFHGLILPARPGLEGGDLEFLPTLPGLAMEALIADQAWMSLVKEIIE
ncbi:hypothetical protein QBC47DRAFT_354681 [Echria macrotheca]|uniref:Trichothecene 3-O-acetyltransferase-like N-terminal domain-containing protein n=1 Tax=Echria macrotheca TaxID=438768 RepID=A0AAJ0F032_9PEZI|nr:hypothetical protein QBC47DRAFT_354681 [Echria macrotheca]